MESKGATYNRIAQHQDLGMLFLCKRTKNSLVLRRPSSLRRSAQSFPSSRDRIIEDVPLHRFAKIHPIPMTMTKEWPMPSQEPIPLHRLVPMTESHPIIADSQVCVPLHQLAFQDCTMSKLRQTPVCMQRNAEGLLCSRGSGQCCDHNIPTPCETAYFEPSSTIPPKQTPAYPTSGPYPPASKTCRSRLAQTRVR